MISQKPGSGHGDFLFFRLFQQFQNVVIVHGTFDCVIQVITDPLCLFYQGLRECLSQSFPFYFPGFGVGLIGPLRRRREKELGERGLFIEAHEKTAVPPCSPAATQPGIDDGIKSDVMSRACFAEEGRMSVEDMVQLMEHKHHQLFFELAVFFYEDSVEAQGDGRSAAGDGGCGNSFRPFEAGAFQKGLHIESAPGNDADNSLFQVLQRFFIIRIAGWLCDKDCGLAHDNGFLARGLFMLFLFLGSRSNATVDKDLHLAVACLKRWGSSA